MKSRHRAREVALQILYGYEIAHTTAGAAIPQGMALAADLRKHFDHFQVAEALREFSAQLVAGTLTEVSQLDPWIEQHASNWKIARMAPVDRTLLRMASYELRKIPETPPSVVIDEAIELAKQFGTAETPAFVNGILDALRKTLV